jgi:flagella basal body P-ring formation protein FlgA
MKAVLLPLILALAAHAAPAPANYDADRLLGDLGRDLVGHFRLEGDLKLDFLRPWSPPTRTATVWSVEIVDYPDQAASNMVVHLQLKADGAVVDDSSVLLHGALWREAWCAREPLPSGSEFDAERLTTENVDYFRQRDALPVTEGDASLMFNRDVPANHLISWHDVVRRPLVHKGEVVDVVATEGLLSLTMKALALENGARGDLVMVRNMESLKNIPAQVVGDDRVQVHF